MALVVDGGIMHLSAALNKKMVAIWGPTGFFRSYHSAIWKTVRYPMSCYPCWDTPRLHECKDMECLTKITAQDVVKAVAELLS